MAYDRFYVFLIFLFHWCKRIYKACLTSLELGQLSANVLWTRLSEVYLFFIFLLYLV